MQDPTQPNGQPRAPIGRSIPIDRKFRFVGYNATNGKIVTEDNGLLFAAKDKAVPATLRFYRAECERLGSNPEHLEAIDLLIGRVELFQARIESHVPDTTAEEARRTVAGVMPERDRQP